MFLIFLGRLLFDFFEVVFIFEFLWRLSSSNFFLHISSSWVKIRLHTENELPMLSGSSLKVELGGGVVVVVQLITLSTLTTVELNKIKVVVRL